jgi:hypothetical protein
VDSEILLQWLKRLAEIVVGLVALAISGLTLWMCGVALIDPSPSAVSGFALWSILALLAGVALAVVVFGIRLILPRLRLDGQHLIGLRGLVAFAYLYGLVIVVGLLRGGAPGGRLIVALFVLAGVGGLIYERLRAGATR